MTGPYIIYGSYASYYTAKVRAYLRKKGIPFTERLPSAPRFRDHVRPTSGTHRIPQLETPAGEIIQDSVEIVDYLEARHPDIPALPTRPRQRLAVHLMELFGSEGLVRLAWQFRWFFPEENYHFVKMEFGRSFRPQGSDEDLLKYGNIIADRMLSRGALDNTETVREDMRRDFLALLARLEAHFQGFPYMLGGHPSHADYAIMGALHAHMGRDPLPLNMMQTHAPRVFRWVEHMLMPEIQSPEFFDTPVAYPDDDLLPQTFVDLLGYFGERYAGQFERNSLAWAEHARLRLEEPKGQHVSEAGEQPVLDPVEITHRGLRVSIRCNVHHAWVTQRAQRYYCSLSPADQSACDVLLDETGLGPLVRTDIVRPLTRRENRLVLA